MEANERSEWLENIEDRVVEAYRKHGLVATTGLFNPAPERRSCCALGALCREALDEDNDNEPVRVVAEALGITKVQVWNFVDGFDRGDCGTPEGEAGRRVFKRLREEGLLL